MRPSAAGVAAVVMALASPSASMADPASGSGERPADLCLEVAQGAVSEDEWTTVTEAVTEALSERTALFPAPQLEQGAARLDIDSGHLHREPGHAGCLEPGMDWTARFAREFLEAGADRMLAEAPTTPGIDSDVTIDWYPSETRVRTTLVFAGPLDIPNGTCWIDDALSVEASTGVVLASGEQGVKTSLFAESACGRFFDHLAEGGAGEQAVTLLPSSVTLSDGTTLRFVAEDVRVADDSIAFWGRLVRS